MKNIEKAIVEINEVIKEFNRIADLLNMSTHDYGNRMAKLNSVRRIIYGQVKILNLLDDEHTYNIEYDISLYIPRMKKIKMKLNNTEV